MLRIEGYVIVSADGMIADANGVMPDFDPQRCRPDISFKPGSTTPPSLVHGRHSHEGGPRAARRKRLVVSRARSRPSRPIRSHPNALLWNPTGATLEQALAELGVGDGIVAIIGGTDVFSMFLPRYDAFHLSRAANAKIPGGRPVFTAVGPNATPEDVLMRHGLKAGPRRDLDAAAGVSVVTWAR